MGAFFSKIYEACFSQQTNDDTQSTYIEYINVDEPYSSSSESEEELENIEESEEDEEELENIEESEEDEEELENIEESEEDEEELENIEESEEWLEEETIIFTVSNEKKALVIGINYNEDEIKDNDLNGCVNDMNNIKDFLHENCFFMDDDIRTLCNSEASRKNIEDEFSSLVVFSHENPGSEIWVSYSGHGSNKFSFEEEDLRSEVICPSDYAINGMISDSWIQENFVKGLEKTTKVFVLMDCCNSGSNLNLPYRCRYGDVATGDVSYTTEELNNLCNIVKISGCEDDQTSADYFERKDNEFQGALTNGFIHFKHNTNNTMVVFYNNILSYLTNRGFTQRPVFSFSKATLLNSKLCQ